MLKKSIIILFVLKLNHILFKFKIFYLNLKFKVRQDHTKKQRRPSRQEQVTVFLPSNMNLNFFLAQMFF